MAFFRFGQGNKTNILNANDLGRPILKIGKMDILMWALLRKVYFPFSILEGGERAFTEPLGSFFGEGGICLGVCVSSGDCSAFL